MIPITLPWASCPSDNSTAQIECTKASATAYFWYREALDASPSIDEPGAPRWWIVLFFYSFGLAFGSLIAFGSYNPPDNNCVRDVLLVSVCNALTAIYASVVIFSILGFKAWTMAEKCITSSIEILAAHHVDGFLPNTTTEYYREHYDSLVKNNITTNLNLSDCSMGKQLNEAAEGTGLAFIVFTQAIVELPFAPFWSIIFFLMLLSLGLGSQIGIMEGMLCTIFDIEFTNDIYEMTGYRPGLYWQLTWRYIGPFIVTCILLSSLVFMTPYPDWVLLIALCMILVGVLPIPVVLLLRRFQCLAFDVDIHQGSIRRIENPLCPLRR
ncbi:hypothetical protein MSG28_013559 [Choristoneura fumiferana]|uniref:Uncharacterized protein n=1 Tax=Choristoneura fumiferana TaxID=7141 RepID=A0ACC0K842_CHOFU|nr:hypothetical protein MSG28_013559 [Choristoneura fumiferana]